MFNYNIILFTFYIDLHFESRSYIYILLLTQFADTIIHITLTFTIPLPGNEAKTHLSQPTALPLDHGAHAIY